MLIIKFKGWHEVQITTREWMSWKHQAKWKKLKTKDHILYQSMYMKCSEYIDNKERKILVNSAGKDFWEFLEQQEDQANQS